MNSKLLIILLVVVLLGGGLYYYRSISNKETPTPQDVTSVTDSSLSRVLNSGELRIGSALEELPWGDIDKNTGKEIGGEVEIANLLAKYVGVKLVLVNKGFDYLIPELLNKQYDLVIAGMSITNDRSKLVNFTVPYLTTGLAIIVKADNKTINSANDLKGKKVGTLSGTTSQTYLQSLSGVDVRLYDDPGKYITDTLNGTIDATVYDATTANYYLKKNPGLKVVGPLLQKERYGMAVRKEDKALLAKLNQVIPEMRKSQEFKTITTSWYGPTE